MELADGCRARPLDPAAGPGPVVRRLGLVEYEPAWRLMRERAGRGGTRRDEEIWLLSHPPVFTLGQAGRDEHVLDPGRIPVLRVDRGGQATYHGPGQLVAYLLLDVRRRGLGPRALVDLIERALVAALSDLGVEAATRPGAPGVYAGGAKLASLGLRIRDGWSYHGLSLNVDMDLEPFRRIDPCGVKAQPVTQLADLIPPVGLSEAGAALLDRLLPALGCRAPRGGTSEEGDGRADDTAPAPQRAAG